MQNKFRAELATFGLKEFRPLQETVIQEIVKSGQAFVVMPTGSGKSLTYQLPALLLPDLTLVLSPLKALMKDQVDKLRGLGISATYINSDVNRQEREKRLQLAQSQKLKLLYVTPERFRKTEFLEAFKTIKVSLLVVDEAHCISQWGHDFRPEYSRVGEIQRFLLKASPDMKTLALTATATSEVKKDILNQLKIPPQQHFFLPITRPNLAIRICDLYGKDQKIESILQILSKQNPSHSTIIYCSLISTLEEFSQVLAQKKIFHEKFHGDLNSNQRKRSQEAFLSGESKLILATPAFGLGVDKSDIRTVIHAEIPGSIEAYFQEIGRAGRDGQPADCILLYDEEDISTQMEFIKWSNPDGSFIRQIFQLVKKNQSRVAQEGADYLRGELNFYNSRDFRTETALNLLRSWDVLQDWTVLSEDLEPWIDDTARSQKLKRQNEKLLNVVQFIKTDQCRAQFIYNYFAESATKPCGLCDNCLV